MPDDKTVDLMKAFAKEKGLPPPCLDDRHQALPLPLPNPCRTHGGLSVQGQSAPLSLAPLALCMFGLEGRPPRMAREGTTGPLATPSHGHRTELTGDRASWAAIEDAGGRQGMAAKGASVLRRGGSPWPPIRPAAPCALSSRGLCSATKCSSGRGPGMDVRGSGWRPIPWEGLVRPHPPTPRPRSVIP